MSPSPEVPKPMLVTMRSVRPRRTLFMAPSLNATLPRLVVGACLGRRRRAGKGAGAPPPPPCSAWSPSPASRGRRGAILPCREAAGEGDRPKDGGGGVPPECPLLAYSAARRGAAVDAREAGVGGIERHQLQHHAVGPAEAVLGRIF